MSADPDVRELARSLPDYVVVYVCVRDLSAARFAKPRCIRAYEKYRFINITARPCALHIRSVRTEDIKELPGLHMTSQRASPVRRFAMQRSIEVK